MKLLGVLLALTTAAMVAMLIQTVRQEYQTRSLIARTLADTLEIRTKEENINTVKTDIRELRVVLATIGGKLKEVKDQKLVAEENMKSSEEELRKCSSTKEEAEKRKIHLTESMSSLKATHQEDKQKAEVDVQQLKQQIWERDKSICAFADTSLAEARRLCGIQ